MKPGETIYVATLGKWERFETNLAGRFAESEPMRQIALIAVVLVLSMRHVDALLSDLIQQNVQDAAQSYERTSSPRQLSTEPARFWVHIRSDRQKEIGKKLLEIVTNANLERRKIESKPLQLVDFGPEKSQLRFFKQQDKIEAAELLEMLRKYIPQIELRDMSREYVNVGWLKSGHYELWLSPELADLKSPE